MLSTIEQWQDIEGFEGLYQVSSTGQVRSVDRMLSYMNHGTWCSRIHRGKLLKQDIDEDGYCRINLRKNSKDFRFGVHRLVAAAFIDNPNDLPVVNHKDGNKQHNCISNLEWCTVEYNNHHAASIGLRPHSIYEDRTAVKRKLSHPVRCIESGVVYPSMIEAERQLGLGSTAVYFSIKNNRPTVQGWTFEKVHS